MTIREDVLNCNVCNKQHNGSFMKSYCSENCRLKAKEYRKNWILNPFNLERDRERKRKDYYNRVKPLQKREKESGIVRCLWCRRILERLYNGTKYCSKDCNSSALTFNKKERQKNRVRGWSWYNVKKDKCEICGSTNNLEIHHTAYIKDYSVCQVLCIDCHRKLHRKEGLI